MSFHPAPKPKREPKVRKPLARSTTPIARSPIKKSGKPIRKVNPERVKRKHVAYRKVIASDFHKKLRYDAYLRSGGYCECERCKEARLTSWDKLRVGAYDSAAYAAATTPIEVWFAKGGGENWQRFRSTEGELHHGTTATNGYKYFGQENPAELKVVRFVHKGCHQRIESEHGTRRRFLRGAK